MSDGGLGEVGASAAAQDHAAREAEEAQAKVEARKKQWDKQQIPDELLAKGVQQVGDATRHLVHFKNPRDGKTSGYIDESVLQDPQVKDEMKKNGVISYKEDDLEQKNPTFDAFAEYGGTEKYSRFLGDMDDATNTDPAKLFTHNSEQNKGIVPKDGVSQEAIALAFDLWNEKQRLEALKKQDEKTLASATDDGMAGVGEDAAPITIQSDETTQSEEKIKTLEAQLEQKTKEDQEAQRLKELQEKKITEPEAQEMLKKLKELEKQERELRKKLANAKPEEKTELELQLKQLTQDKFAEILKALGYSEESITQLLSSESNLPVVMRLVRHTSRSKDLQSPAVREICRFAKHELISSVQELINKTEDEGKKSSWNTVRTMKAFKALRIAMEVVGITGPAQDAKIAELQQSTNERGLLIKPEGSKNLQGENDEDTLTILLEALIKGEPDSDVGRNLNDNFGGIVERLKKEFEGIKKEGEKFDEWLKTKLNQLHPEIGEAAAVMVTKFLDEHLDLGAFMEMLLTGDTYTSLARDLGYKSKEHLKAEGKDPVGAEEVDIYIRKGGTHAENARKLLCAGLKDIIRDETLDVYRNGSAVNTLKNPAFREALSPKIAFSKENHKIFATQILYEMGKGDENTQEKNKTELTEEAIVYIMSLPEMAEKLKWEDGGGLGEEKKKGGEVKEVEKPGTTSTTPSPAAESGQTEAPTTQQPLVTETKT